MQEYDDGNDIWVITSELNKKYLIDMNNPTGYSQVLEERITDKHLQKQYWGRHLWARGYFVASSGNVTDEVIMAYIREQEGNEPGDGGDNFRVTTE